MTSRAPLPLREIQALFWEAVRHPVGIDAFLNDATQAQRAAFDSELMQTEGFSRRQRMTVYAESYFWRLLDVLTDQYRVVAWLCGTTRFHNLVTDFVWERPSTTGNLRQFGAGFAAYIGQHAIADEVADLASLAKVERCIVTALDAPDVVPLSIDTLAQRPPQTWPTMRLVAPPFVTLLATTRSYPQLDAARRRVEDPPQATAPAGQTHHVLVGRTGVEVFHRSVAAAEARALRAMLDGACFEQICAAAADLSGADPGLTGADPGLAGADPGLAGADPPAPATVVGWLRGWLESELVSGFNSER